MARILVIDDEANIRLMLRLALQQAGHTVGQAADGYDGLEKYDADPAGWDLVLLDHRMPGMEGLEVLRRMRARNPDARVIMITAFGTVDLAVDTMKAGATDFLRKPFTLETLRGAVGVALAGQADASNRSAEAPPAATHYEFSTLNGFSIESLRAPTQRRGGDILHKLSVRSPDAKTADCEVVLPAYVVEQVQAETGCEEMPNGDLFWQGMCEEALANYIWQNASVPPGGVLRVDEYTTGMRRWVGQVLATGA